MKHRVSRRTALGLGALGAGSLAILSACSTSTGGSGGSGTAGGQTTLWYWPEGFDEAIVADVEKSFPDAGFRQVIQGGDFKQKLQTTLQAGSGLPNLTGIKGEDIAHFASVPEFFVDLNELGAEEHRSSFVDWKWAQATTADGKQLGIPIDIGPTALFYRFDTFEKHGLPSDPAEVSAALKDWDAYIEFGTQLHEADPEIFMVRNLASIFRLAQQQSGQSFIDESGSYIGDGDHVREAWDLVVRVQQAGINAAIEPNTADSSAAIAAGKLPADPGASWHLADLIADAPDTSGNWHVATHPGEATNRGGSFLGIPAKGEDHETAFEIILQLLNAANQAKEYVHSGNFPANIEAQQDDKVTGEVEFLGGQEAGEVFAEAATTVRPLFEDPRDGTVNGPFYAELQLIESSGKDPEQAWTDAVTESKRLAEQNGVTVA